MPAPTIVRDPYSDSTARVTKYGQLVVAPLSYSVPVAIELDTINTAFNFIEPQANHSIVITDIIVSANKNVSATDPANIEIYEADGADELTAAPSIVRPQLSRSSNVSYIGLNLLVPEGKWVNAKTDDSSVLVTIMYYRVPVEDL